MPTLGMKLVSGSLFNISALKAELEELAQRFIKLYGPGFQDAVLDA